MMKTLNIVVTGKVQGVWFRKYTQEKALELGLTGWVKNLPTGNQVEIMVSGTKEQLELFKEWCHQGSPLSKVESVSHKEIPSQNFDGFVINK